MIRIMLTLLAVSWSAAVWSLSAADFFVAPDMLAARLSPDGNSVAAIVGIDDDQSLVVIDTQTGQRTSLLEVAEFSENEASLLSTTWLDNTTVAALFTEVRAGIKDLLDTKRNRYLLIVRVPQVAGEQPEILSVRTSGILVDPLPEAPGEFLYAKSSPLSRVYRVNVAALSPYGAKLSRMDKVDGGQFVRSNEVAQVQGYALRWFMAADGTPRAVLNYSDGALVLTAFDSADDTRELARWDEESTENEEEDAVRLIPVAAADGVDRFYCLDVNAENVNSVYLMDYATDEQTLVYTSSDTDIVDFIVSERDNQLVGVSVMQDGQLRHNYFDPDAQAAQLDPNSSALSLVIGRTGDGSKSLKYLEAHDEPGQFQLTTSGGTSRVLGGHSPGLNGRLDSTLIDGKVTVEGLDIPYLLTLPAQTAPAPLVVMPHGGPFNVFDTRYFDETTQFLNANGYAVLRVNFRGSGGYSTAFEEAGEGQFGGLMLEDIHSAAQEVAARPDIDAGRVAVFGASYGGYAATMLATRHPQFYRCAVSLAGVMDINLWLNRTDFTEAQRTWAKDMIGDSVEDYDMLKGISPISHVQALQVPILVAHGAKDDVVDVEHAYRLRRMLDRYAKTYQWQIFDDATHHFSSIEQTVELHDKVLAFLSQHVN